MPDTLLLNQYFQQVSNRNLQGLSANTGMPLNGLNLWLTDALLPTGGLITTTPSAGTFGSSYSVGVLSLVTETANNNAKSDQVLFEVQIPPTYQVGANLTLTVNARLILGSGTVSVNTITAAAQSLVNGVAGTNLMVTTGVAQTPPTAAAGNLTYVVPAGSGTANQLQPGGKLMLTLTWAITSTTAFNVNGAIYQITLS